MPQMNVAGAIAKLLETMGTEFVFGMNGHGNWALLDAIVHETRIRGIPVRAEDQAVHMADGYWRMNRKAPLAIVDKKRKSATDVEMLSVIGDVDGKTVLLVDDLTETAGTVTRAAEILKKKGAKKVYASVSHAVLNPAALDRLKASELEELVTTDTVPHSKVSGFKLTELTVAPLLGEAIKRIHNSESVSSLFDINGKRPES